MLLKLKCFLQQSSVTKMPPRGGKKKQVKSLGESRVDGTSQSIFYSNAQRLKCLHMEIKEKSTKLRWVPCWWNDSTYSNKSVRYRTVIWTLLWPLIWPLIWPLNDHYSIVKQFNFYTHMKTFTFALLRWIRHFLAFLRKNHVDINSSTSFYDTLYKGLLI